MLDALRRRFEDRKDLHEKKQAMEVDRLKQMERIVQQAGVMENLLEDPRYHDYKQLLDEARDTLVQQLVTLRCQEAASFQHELAVLQGRIIQLDAILSTPQTFLTLAEQAEQGDTATGASRQSAPNGHARLATSGR